MKVLHLIPSFGSGGAERQLSILAPALAEAGIECHVGYCQEGPNFQALQESRVHLHHLKVGGNHDPSLFIKIFRLIRTIRPDVVQTWLLQMDVMGGLAALLGGVPFVLSERSSAAAYVAGWKMTLRKKVGLAASAIIANSQGGVDYWRAQGARKPIYLIRNFILPAISVPCEADIASPAPPLILFAGRLHKEKNVIMLLDALIQVAIERTDCHVSMFGTGPLEDVLRRKIQQTKMDERIKLRGYVRDLSTWMGRSDICVSISEFEGNPNVVLEAAAHGCPLVLSDIPAHREIFDEASAWFVRDNSAAAVKETILDALREEQERMAKAEQARQWVSAYTLESIQMEYMRAYSLLLTDKTGPGCVTK